MAGRVAIVTGASRGIGKGIAESLAQAGCTVYVTGRSSTGNVTDILMGGTVDETAAMLTKAGGSGVAVHADHAQMQVNKALARLIQEQHGRLDTLVNNAFFISKPDSLFFQSRVWQQPGRFLNEQYAVGGYDKGTMTLLNLSSLRRGHGFVVNVGSWGSQINLQIFPISYFLNKAAYDQTNAALGVRLAKYNISVVSFWPGSVRSERSIIANKKSTMDFGLADAESVRFSGKAVVLLSMVPPETRRKFAGRVMTSFDTYTYGNSHDTDGYLHEPNAHTVVGLHSVGS
jgi:NAD(P)-dependent dehydrogenase (short-subunit alcohol dehydrogenase family)